MSHPTTNYKVCTKCAGEFPATSEFWYKSLEGKYGFHSICKACKSSAIRKYPLAPEGFKLCRKCGVFHPETEQYFYASKGALTSPCKNCRATSERQKYEETREQHNKRSREYYAENKARISDVNRRYRESHKDEIKEYHSQYYQENRETHALRMRAYYEENKERLSEQTKQYRETRKEWFSEYGKQYRANNRSRISLSKKAWVKRNPARVRAISQRFYLIHGRNNVYEQRRRAKKKGLPSTFTPQEWQACLVYFNHTCAVCGNQLRDLFGNVKPHQDHWIPLASELCTGTVATNMVCLCNSCNHQKSFRLPHVWLEEKYGNRKAKEIIKRVQAYFDSLA